MKANFAAAALMAGAALFLSEFNWQLLACCTALGLLLWPDKTRPIQRHDLLAAWAYDRVVGEEGRRAILNRLSAEELATLLQARALLETLPNRGPATLPHGDAEDWVLEQLRRHRLLELRAGRSEEAASRLLREIESGLPRALKKEMAVAELRRLSWAHPELLLETLRSWRHRPTAAERFSSSLAREPARMERLIVALSGDEAGPLSLSPEAEVAVCLQLLEPELAAIYREELGHPVEVSAGESDRHLVAEKLVTRLWVQLSRDRSLVTN